MRSLVVCWERMNGQPSSSEEKDQIQARRTLHRQLSGKSASKTIPDHMDGAEDDDIALPVVSALAAADERLKLKSIATIDERKLHRAHTHVAIRLSVHMEEEEPQKFLLSAAESISMANLQQLINERCGLSLRLYEGKKEEKIYGILPSGEVVCLSSTEAFHQFAAQMWCTQPWQLHVTADKEELQITQVEERASVLFEAYDVNRDGCIDRVELLRMHRDLRLERLDIFDELLNRFVEAEFRRLSAWSIAEGLDPTKVQLPQFVSYVVSLGRWMKRELFEDLLNPRTILELMAARATERSFGPSDLPRLRDDGAGRLAVARVNTGDVLGIRLDIPQGALLDTGLPRSPSQVRLGTAAPSRLPEQRETTEAKVAVHTLATSSVRYLSEKLIPGSSLLGFPFSAIVRIDYPAFEGEDDTPPELGTAPHAPHFSKPLLLTMPHCSKPNPPSTSWKLFGAPHGAERWEQVSTITLSDGTRGTSVEESEMRVHVPYAGTFAAFFDMDVAEQTVAVRFHIFTSPTISIDTPSTLRVYLCPTLPTQLREIELIEQAEWGASQCVGQSRVIYLRHGSRLQLRYLDQQSTLEWEGLRVNAEFTLPVSRIGSLRSKCATTLAAGSSDVIQLDIVPGRGPHAANVAVVAQHAGIPSKDYEIAFSVALRSESRLAAPKLQLESRTASDFSVTWTEPPSQPATAFDQPSRCVTHYALELATATFEGTYRPFELLWCGAGHTFPDFADRIAQRQGSKRRSSLTDSAAPAERKRRGSLGANPNAAESEHDAAHFTYLLEVHPDLSGKLRIRCWQERDVRPSPYSAEVFLPRFKGLHQQVHDEGARMIQAERSAYFLSLDQHVTDGGQPLHYRIGNAACRIAWGGDTMPKSQPTEKERAKGYVRPPVPFDVPRLPPETPGLQEAGASLAGMYRHMGVFGGGSGQLCGLSIDHVVHAIVGTPTCDGRASPSRTCASIRQPLIAFIEVLYADVVIAQLDRVAVAKAEWKYVVEKLHGLVAKVSTQGKHYHVCEPMLRKMIAILASLTETMRQCDEHGVISLHLTRTDHTSAIQSALKKELTTRMCNLLWILSIETLRMLIEVQRPMSAAQLVAGARIANAAALRYRSRKWRQLWRKAFRMAADQAANMRELKQAAVEAMVKAAKVAMNLRPREPLQMAVISRAPSLSSKPILSRVGSKRGSQHITRRGTGPTLGKAHARHGSGRGVGASFVRHSSGLGQSMSAILAKPQDLTKQEAFALRSLQADQLAAEKKEMAAAAAAHAEAEKWKDERVNEVARIFMGHTLNRQLVRSWRTWTLFYVEVLREKHLLLHAAVKVFRPLLGASYAHWRSDWIETAKRQAAQRAAEARAAAMKRQYLLELSIRKTPPPFFAPPVNIARAHSLVAKMERRVGTPSLRRPSSAKYVARGGLIPAPQRYQMPPRQWQSRPVRPPILSDKPPSLAVYVHPRLISLINPSEAATPLDGRSEPVLGKERQASPMTASRTFLTTSASAPHLAVQQHMRK